ncbi:MAG: hypothetical protein M1818_007219 [Claussenomyces sp. TS43310]|nr:MAG: hypothetical protein M1818_007219 [Claussenomyces sp. TS43310]
MPVDADIQIRAMENNTTDERRVSVVDGTPVYPEEKLGRNPDTHSLSVTTDGVPNDAPTPAELEGPHALKRISAPIPWDVYAIAFIELCERFSYYGTTIVLSNYINKGLPNGSLPGSNPKTGAGGGDPNAVSGALGMGSSAANGIVTFLNFWVYTTPLLGAYIADAHLGRFKTIFWAVAIAIFAHILLIISAVPGVIDNKSGSLACLILGIIVLGLGTGGFKPNISPLIVEQIPVQNIRVVILPTGERVIVDPTITQSRIYHYFYLFINIGALVGQIGMAYCEKYVGFWLSFLLPTVMFCICPLVMLWGKNRYVQNPPTGSVFQRAFQILFFAQKGRWSINPVSTYKRLNDGTFWHDVKPSQIEPSRRPAWMTFDDAWVDEVRRGFAACSVFCWYPLYWICYNQINNNLTVQAAAMTLHGVPNDVINNLDPFALIILIPVCDTFLYPGLRKMGIRFSPIKKITAGFFTGLCAMIWAMVVQIYMYRKSPCGYNATTCVDAQGNTLASGINVWAQTGSYVLIALSEIFASITSLEYAYSKAPRNMRSLVQAVALFTSAIAAAICEALNPLAQDPNYIWNYGVVAVLAGIGGVLFYLNFRHLDAEDDQLNLLPEGHVVVSKDIEEYGEEVRPVNGEISEKY